MIYLNLFLTHELHFADLVQVIHHLQVCSLSSPTYATHSRDMAIGLLHILALILFALFMYYVFLIYAILIVLLTRRQVGVVHEVGVVHQVGTAHVLLVHGVVRVLDLILRELARHFLFDAQVVLFIVGWFFFFFFNLILQLILISFTLLIRVYVFSIA